ncbi:hypothetical protein HK405_011069, partial [Cladochytrium tenue]
DVLAEDHGVMTDSPVEATTLVSDESVPLLAPPNDDDTEALIWAALSPMDSRTIETAELPIQSPVRLHARTIPGVKERRESLVARSDGRSSPNPDAPPSQNSPAPTAASRDLAVVTGQTLLNGVGVAAGTLIDASVGVSRALWKVANGAAMLPANIIYSFRRPTFLKRWASTVQHLAGVNPAIVARVGMYLADDADGQMNLTRLKLVSRVWWDYLDSISVTAKVKVRLLVKCDDVGDSLDLGSLVDASSTENILPEGVEITEEIEVDVVGHYMIEPGQCMIRFQRDADFFGKQLWGIYGWSPSEAAIEEDEMVATYSEDRPTIPPWRTSCEVHVPERAPKPRIEKDKNGYYRAPRTGVRIVIDHEEEARQGPKFPFQEDLLPKTAPPTTATTRDPDTRQLVSSFLYSPLRFETLVGLLRTATAPDEGHEATLAILGITPTCLTGSVRNLLSCEAAHLPRAFYPLFERLVGGLDGVRDVIKLWRPFQKRVEILDAMEAKASIEIEKARGVAASQVHLGPITIPIIPLPSGSSTTVAATHRKR